MKKPKEYNPTNDPLRADLIKLGIMVNSESCEHIHKDYIIQKLFRILKGTMKWHPSIENAYENGNQYDSSPVAEQTDMFKESPV